jgi:hypothetical protein
LKLTTHGRRRSHGFLPQLDEFYFTTDEKKLLEKYRCIVPKSSSTMTNSFRYSP